LTPTVAIRDGTARVCWPGMQSEECLEADTLIGRAQVSQFPATHDLSGKWNYF